MKCVLEQITAKEMDWFLIMVIRFFRVKETRVKIEVEPRKNRLLKDLFPLEGGFINYGEERLSCLKIFAMIWMLIKQETQRLEVSWKFFYFILVFTLFFGIELHIGF